MSVLTDDFGETNYYALINSDLNVIDDNLNTSEVDSFSNFKMSGSVQNNVQRVYGTIENLLKIRSATSGTFELSELNIQEFLTSPPTIFIDEQGLERLLIGTENGKIFIYESSSNPGLIDSLIFGGDEIIKQIAADENYIVTISLSDVLTSPNLLSYNYFDNEGNSISFDEEIITQLALTKDSDGEYLSILLSNSNKFYVIKSGDIISQFTVSASQPISKFALTDLLQDGNNYIVINNGINVEAYNFYGVLADNFPFTDPLNIGFMGTPVCADFEGDSNSEIISVTKDGRIFAIDGGTGKVVSGFPISCGAGITRAPSLYNANGVTNLAVLNDQNILSAWSISSVEGKLYWSEEFGNPQNTSFIDAAENTNRINDFFPTNRAYNYPNPVYEGTTNIRYYVSEDASVNIKIFDLAGDYVAQLNDEAQGGMDNETVWDVSNIQSGIYFARIEATSNSQTEQVVIKIAVVK